MSTQDDCRSAAEDRVANLPGVDNMSAQQHNAALVDQFSSCMVKAGWHVARPAAPVIPGQQVAQQPAQPLPGQPSSVITSAARPAPQPQQQRILQPVRQQPVQTQNTTLQPSPSSPALNQPVDHGASVYQPSGAPSSSGENLGRHF